MRHVGEEPVHFVRRVDHHLGMGHGEGDVYLAPVAGRGDEGVQAAFEVGSVPVGHDAF